MLYNYPDNMETLTINDAALAVARDLLTYKNRRSMTQRQAKYNIGRLAQKHTADPESLKLIQGLAYVAWRNTNKMAYTEALKIIESKRESIFSYL